MDLLITNPAVTRRLIRDRRSRGIDRFDEVWDGVYIMSPQPSDEHQDLTGLIYFSLQVSIGFAGLGQVRTGPGISDRESDWTRNYRVPDVAVFLNGTTAVNKGSHWLGGPDFAVEVISPHDRSRKKFEFYARVGVRELLLVARKPWALELYRLVDGAFVLIGKSSLESPEILTSEVIPLSFRLEAGGPRPRVLIRHSDGVQTWSA